MTFVLSMRINPSKGSSKTKLLTLTEEFIEANPQEAINFAKNIVSSMNQTHDLLVGYDLSAMLASLEYNEELSSNIPRMVWEFNMKNGTPSLKVAKTR